MSAAQSRADALGAPDDPTGPVHISEAIAQMMASTPHLGRLAPEARRLADEHDPERQREALRRRLRAALDDPLTIEKDPEYGEHDERVVFGITAEDLQTILAVLSERAA